MNHDTKSPPILINNPLTLLYWLFFRALALRRYAQSIHEDLDERLKVWKVGKEVGDKPRFEALCRARWWLLATGPISIVFLMWGISLLFGIPFSYGLISLSCVTGYTFGVILSNTLFFRYKKIVYHILFFLILFTVYIIVYKINLLFNLLFVINIINNFNKILIKFIILNIMIGLVFGITVSMMIGIARGMAFGISFNIAFGIMFSIAFGILLGLENLVVSSVLDSIVTALMLGLAIGIVAGFTLGIAVGLARGVKLGVVGGVAVCMAIGVVGGVAIGVVGGVAFGVAFIIAFLRLPFYFWELPRSLLLNRRARQHPNESVMLWRRQPLHYDEVIQLPLMGLPEHVATMGKYDQVACLEALADLAASLRQQWAIAGALNLILSDELVRCKTVALLRRFDEAVSWLPMDLFEADVGQLVADLRRISRETDGALLAQTRQARQTRLQEVAEELKGQRLALGRQDRARLRGYAELLVQWQRLLEAEAERVAQEREAVGELPMRYLAGAVLERGAQSFYGRSDLFRKLEGLLINQSQKITPLLLGQPRTGKSSVLKQLPLRLGSQVLPIYLDMEGQAMAASAEGFLSDIMRQIRTEALRHPDAISLSAIDEQLLAADPYRLFENWLAEVEQKLGKRRWLLLALDEFDRLDNAVRAGRLDERIFFLLRRLIQHHSQVVLALCGTFSLAECDPRWYEALKSVRNLPVSYLQPEEARHLFTQPTPDFPPTIYSDAAIERAVTLTGGQPFLIHLLGETIINRYNQERSQLPPNSPSGLPIPVKAIDDAIPGVLKGGEPFFVSLWQWLLKISHAPHLTEQLLSHLARQQPIEEIGSPLERADLLELFCERDLLEADTFTEDNYRFQVPLVGEWIRKQRRLPRLVER